MNLLQTILEAFESLAANKMRSGLTVLGIVIGVGAVIAMLGLGAGAQESIAGSINSIGTNLLFVVSGGADDSVKNVKPLTLADAQALADPLNAPDVLAVAPQIQGGVEVTFNGQSKSTSGIGVTPAYETVRNAELSEGEFISEDHLLARSAVAVLGTDVADALFGKHEDVTGQTVRVNNQPFVVIGVLKSKGGSGFGSQDDQILVPLTTAQSRIVGQRGGGLNEVDSLSVQAVSAEAVPQAIEEISAVLRARHRTDVGKDDFQILSQQDFLATADQITGVLTIVLGGIAAISLLVGGIGIMNIMLVSVTERTREIGLRKALGARQRDILIQFLTESAVLSTLGGLIGIALGYGLATLVGYIAAANDAALNPAIGPSAILLATLFSAAVGLFFGIYPASRAARLEPVEALRYE